MARGITENDVWTACDALLLSGARPTIERVRQHIGSGSPNTVSPYLDTWFKGLGGRIKDPAAFAAPPELPDPIQQAAKHFWEVALAETRRDFDQRIQEGLAAAVANVEAEKERSGLAQAAAFDAASKAVQLRAQVAEFAGLLDRERIERATASAHLEDARHQARDLQSRLDRMDAEIREVRNAARREVEAAIERAEVAERRAGLEIDAQRIARVKAERRADATEQKLEAANADARAALAQHRQTEIGVRADCEALRQELAGTASALLDSKVQVERLVDLLATERSATERARGEADVARDALLHFEGHRASQRKQKPSK